MKGKEKLCVIGTQNDDLEKEMSELRGVMYMMKRRDREHAKTDAERRELLSHLTLKEREDR